MARYEHLPIYKQALDVAVHFERVVAGFSRYHKYTLGAELRSQSRAVVVAIVKANAARDKQALLLALREKLDELLITVRIAKEAKAFKSFESFQYAIEQVIAVCRQNEGWLRATRQKA
jgi:23S rRNA-intervening sequence protein